MEIKSLRCPACGAPVKAKEFSNLATCEYCGHQILIEMAGNNAPGPINATNTSNDQARKDMKVLQISNEISTLQTQLANLRAEKRALERERSSQKRKQLGQIKIEEESLIRRKVLLEVELVALNGTKSGSSVQKSEMVSPVVPAAMAVAAVANRKKIESSEISDKSKSTALWLSIFTGIIGLHRFYTGHILIGILQFCTMGGFLIWWVIDIIAIASGKFRDSHGRLLDANKPANPWIKNFFLILLLAAVINGFLQSLFGYSVTDNPDTSSGPITILSFILSAAIVNIKWIIGFIGLRIQSRKP